MLSVAVAAYLQRGQSAAEDFTLNSKPPQLLVLFDGRVLFGKISECPGGYFIEQAGSKQVIPFEHIRLAASSLDDAYVKQRDGMNKPTANDHLALAQWCYDLKLYNHASEQLTAALKLEPNRSEARALLQRVADASPEAAGIPASNGRRAKASTGRAAERTAAGISPQSQSEYVSRVQPILMNRCGNGSCHGSASNNSLKLANVRTGRRQQRLETEGNLAAVLRHLDYDKPDMSPLVRVPVDGESRSHRGIFSGPAGPTQLERLRTWVQQVANELHGDTKPLWASEAAESDSISFGWSDSQPVQQAVHEADPESPLLIEIPIGPQADERGPVTPASSTAARRPKAAEKRPAMTEEERSAFLRNVLEQDRDDAFDPDEFNRQVHGGGRAPAGR